LSYTELLARSGRSEQQQRNEHAALSVVTRELFGEKRWPVENWQQGSPNTEGRAEMLYRMPPTIAEWFRAIPR